MRGSFEVTDIRTERVEGDVRLAAVVRHGADAEEVWFRTSEGPVAATADPFLPVVLFPAMRMGAAVRIRGPVSRPVLENIVPVQHVRMVWDRASSLVAVDVEREVPGPAEAGAGVGSFFSGGVDSFYTLFRERAAITHLLIVQGFDIPVQRDRFYARVLEGVREVARALGCEVLAVQTNVRQLSGQYVSWDDFHGAAMAAVAYFLGPRLRRVLVPSSYAYAFLEPLGSHPGLDPLWGTPTLEVVHHGCEATRFQKVQQLAAWDLALRHLRVCWQLDSDAFNCGQCRKCLWTMAFLRACGALERAATFPHRLDLEALRRWPPSKRDELARFVQALAVVEARGDDPELAACLREGIARARRPPGIRSLPARVAGRLRRAIGTKGR